LDYEHVEVYADADSINDRGVGDRTLEIKSQGLHTATSDVTDFTSKSARRIFNRYSVPPIKLSIKMPFKELRKQKGFVKTIN